jgi:hypothetical protein
MFLGSPFARPIITLCLAAERTGIINIAWSLAALQRKVLGMHPDETYLGTKPAALVTSSSTSSTSNIKQAAGANDDHDDDDNNNNKDISEGCSSSETRSESTTGDDLTTQQAYAMDLDQLEIEIDHER